MKITFIGGGNMASALIAGLAGKLTNGASISVVDPNRDALDRLRTNFGVRAWQQVEADALATEVWVLAVKPDQMREVATALQPHLGVRPLVMSIAAGISSADLSRWLGGYDAIVRCMPNTPALIGMGITGMAAMAGVGKGQRAAADSIMRAVGQAIWLEDEAQIDAVTAVSGSGPAYVFYFMEAMEQAAREMGLSDAHARLLAAATFTGAATLAQQSADDVQVLRQRVTSKGGTTHAAIVSMEQAGIKQSIVDAMKAAQARAREMGEEMGNR
ncbi:MAG TPA: pyrroline-5-carboxylate reductase [Telluria sp.]